MSPDARYDPCKRGSKLGGSVSELHGWLTTSSVGLDGLHIHTNSDSVDFNQLFENVCVLCDALSGYRAFEWINLGGGYLLESSPLEPLVRAVTKVKIQLGAQVFIEPGAGLVRAAGYLVGSVLDVFNVDGGWIAVLDTTVNHMPEVLEFDYQPDAVNQTDDGPYEYLLAGSTCLAGDIFGTYRFLEPLAVGKKVAFEEAGAYTLVKAHRFNGVNLPQIGMQDFDGQYRVIKTFGYRDFASYWDATSE